MEVLLVLYLPWI